MPNAGKEEKTVRTRLGNRIRAPKGGLIYRIFSDLGYVFLSFMALFLSAVFHDFMWQFMTLALILGLKWAFGNRAQVIQIFSSE